MFSLLFHKDVFVPKGVQEQVLKLESKMTNYFLSQHFKEHLDNQENEDRSHTYFRNAVYNALKEMISDSRVFRSAFEIELSKCYKAFGVHDWIVTKYCIRLPYTLSSDLVVVIRPQWDIKTKTHDASRNMIVTAWINHNKDDHKTLDTTKYCSEEFWTNCNK